MSKFTGVYVVKIGAVSYHRYMWYKTPHGVKCAYIDDDTYQWLKSLGIPTSQYLRYHKEIDINK